jgi:hypothetical protein
MFFIKTHVGLTKCENILLLLLLKTTSCPAPFVFRPPAANSLDQKKGSETPYPIVTHNIKSLSSQVCQSEQQLRNYHRYSLVLLRAALCRINMCSKDQTVCCLFKCQCLNIKLKVELGAKAFQAIKYSHGFI